MVLIEDSELQEWLETGRSRAPRPLRRFTRIAHGSGPARAQTPPPESGSCGCPCGRPHLQVLERPGPPANRGAASLAVLPIARRSVRRRV